MSKEERFIKKVEEGDLCHQDIIDLWKEKEKLLEIAKAVAHIGVDFGYGKYEIEQCFIDDSRKIFKAIEEENET